LIKIESNDYPPLRLGDATKLHAGDTVWTIGAPHGLEFSVTKGIASFVGRNVGGKSFIQADVAINPGNSGGPMINDQGEVIGINNFIIKQTVGLNFAIPVNYFIQEPFSHLGWCRSNFT
jgi:serine protease Do